MISRDELLNLLLEEFKTQFGFQIDFDNPNLETWLVQTLSILDENQLMYLSLLMNESFLSTALLPSTIKKFATDFGYKYKRVQPAHGYIDIYVGLTQTNSNIDAEIPFDATFEYNDIVYIPTQKVYITYTQATGVVNIIGYDLNGNKFVIPYTIEIISDGQTSFNAIHFKLDIIQAKRNIYSFTVTTQDVENYKFPSFTIPYPQEGQVSSFNVYVSGSPAEQKQFLFELDPDKYSYIVVESPQGYEIIFGNSLIGRALRPGDVVTVETLVSLGSKGNVYANSLTLTTQIVNKVTGSPLTIVTRHPDITNGKDAEKPNEIRLNTIRSLHLNKRLVTKRDFQFLPEVISLPFKEVKVFFSESDLHVNEVDVFGFIEKNGNVIRTNSVVLTTGNEVIKQFSELYQPDITKPNVSETQQFDTDTIWYLPFEIFINTDTMVPLAFFYPMDTQLDFRIIQENYYSLDRQSYIKLTDSHLKYDDENLTPYLEFTFLLNVGELDQTHPENNLAIELSLNQSTKTFQFDSWNGISYDPVTNVLKIKVNLDSTQFDDSLITGELKLKYKFASETEYESLCYVEFSPFKLKYNITNYVPLKLSWKQVSDTERQYTIYSIPAFYSKEIMQELTSMFTSSVQEIANYKMITNKVSLNFAKTFGTISNVKYSKSNINTAKPNEFTIPLKLKVIAYVSTSKPILEIQQEIKDVLKDIIQPKIEQPIIRSQLIRQLHDRLSYITDLELYLVDKDGNLQQKDIDFYYTDKDLTKQDILTYAPEVIYVTDDSIDVDVKYAIT